MVTAHRGCWADAPENSLAAIEACADIGPDIIEIDLRLSADGALVAVHDSTLRRMAGVDRPIAEMTLEELQGHPLRNRDGRGDVAMTDERTPTLRDVLRVNARRHLLILDLKSEPLATARAAAQVLEEENACDIALVAFVAPPDAVRSALGPLLDCAAYLPNLRTPMGPMSAVAPGYAPLDPIAVAVRFDAWDYLYEGTDEVRDMGARLWVNTLDDHHAAGLVDADALVNPEALWGRLIDAGVDMIQTDEPQALVDYLKTRRSPAERFMALAHDPASKHVMVEAHRGAWSATVPENSIAAIERAITLGVDMIELDVRQTRDGQIVLMHDATLDRTTDTGGRVDEMDARAVTQARLRSPDGTLTEERAPLLRDAAQRLRGRILVRLDFKCRPDCVGDALQVLLDEGLARQLVVYESKLPYLAGAGVPDNQILVIGPQTYELARGETPHPDVDILQFKDFDPAAPPLNSLQRFVTTHRIVAAPYRGARAGERGDEISLEDPDAGWGWLIDAGVDVLLTDEAEAARVYLEGQNQRQWPRK